MQDDHYVLPEVFVIDNIFDVLFYFLFCLIVLGGLYVIVTLFHDLKIIKSIFTVNNIFDFLIGAAMLGLFYFVVVFLFTA